MLLAEQLKHNELKTLHADSLVETPRRISGSVMECRKGKSIATAIWDQVADGFLMLEENRTQIDPKVTPQ